MLRRVGLLLALVFVLVTAPATRADDANRACDNDQDVTIVVDFGSLGGGVNVRCAVGFVKGENGFKVFRRADVAYETVTNSEFVCRIAARPGPDTEDCANTPPPDAYWTYSYAKRGGDWVYANVGPGSHKPQPGSFEGWRFNNGDGQTTPRYPVPAPQAPPATTATTTPPSPGADAPSPIAGVPTTRADSGAPIVTTTSTTLGALTTTTGDTLSDHAIGRATTTSLKLGDVDLTATAGDGGTSLGFIASVLVLVVLAVGVFVFIRQQG